MKAALALAALLALAAAGCAGKHPHDTHPRGAIVLTPESGSKEITLAVGERIVFEAPENPTTGYVWVASHDASVLEATSSAYAPDPAAPETVGSGGTRTMTFTAVAAGRTELALSRQRPTVPGSSAEDLRFSVSVR